MQCHYLVPALILILASQAQAGIYKCQGPDGRLSFSSKPCPAQAQQIEHRRSAEEKQHQPEAAASQNQHKRQAQDTGTAPQNAYDRLMQKLAGQVYRRSDPVADPKAAAQPDSEPAPETKVDNLVGELIHTMEQGLTFEVEPGSRFDPVSNNPEDASVPQVATYLAANLHNPASLEVIEWGPVLKVIQIDKQDFSSTKQYRLRLRFRAKNGLGRYVPLDQVFILDSNANVQRVTDFDGRPLQDY